MIKLPIYMDNQATTPVDPRVLEAMLPGFTAEFGNPASRNHSFGWNAEKSVENARRQIASFIKANPQEIIFTSGATESNNIALKGAFEIYSSKGNHIITQATEHKSVLDVCKYLESQGVEITYLPVDRMGKINPAELRKAINEKTILISIMFANNEIGTLQPVEEIGRIAKASGVLFHCDGAQAAGRIPMDVEKYGIDLLSLSAHKMYGPKGIGVLYVRKKNPHVRLAPLMHGGGHEQGLRSGTLNAPAIAGFGKACEIAENEMGEESKRVAALRDRLKQGLENQIEDIYLNGHPAERLSGNLNLSFAYVEAEPLLKGINEEVAVSSASACSSGTHEPSYVLKALGVREDLIHSSVRFSLGRFNTEEEVDYAVHHVVNVVKNLRQHSPFYKMAKQDRLKSA